MLLYHAFKYFLSSPHPDKVPTTMTHSLPLPSKQLPPILKQWSFDDSIPHTICQLKELPIDPNTLKDLQATNVTKISHYRCDDVMHEHIVVHFAYQPDQAKPPLPVDTRLARIERFKCDNGRPGKLESSPCVSIFILWPVIRRLTFLRLIQDIIRASKSQWKLDNIYISNELDKNIDKENSPGVVRPGYELLRSFSPPPGSLNILQFLAIVNAVSSTASHYSALHYMCLWFATSVYLATKQYISFSGKEHTSSHLAQAGTAKGLPLVNPHTGDLTFVLKSKLNDLYNNFLAQGVSHDVLVDLMDIIAKDEVLFKEEGNVQLLAVSSIVTAAQVQYDLLEEFFEKKCRAAQYHLVCAL